MLETSLQDLRIGLRLLRRDKSFSAIAIAVLAIGVCAVATQFSVVDATFLRGFSFPNADRMVSVQFIDPTRTTPFGTFNQILTLDYVEMREQQRSLDRMAAYINGATVNMTIDGGARRFTGAYVTDEFLEILGVNPILGRDFEPADNTAGSPKVAIIGHELWQSEFGGDPGVLGKGVRLNGKPATIVGVMGKGFAFPANEQLWIPLFNEYPPTARNDTDAAGNGVGVLALSKAGKDAGLADANAEFGAIAKRFAQTFPDTNKAFDTALVQPLIKTFSPAQLRGTLLTMLAFCVGVLALACVNVMNMQFARATLRARELAIRSSLGATRSRLIRQMLTESSIVATVGAAIGIGLTFWTTKLLMDATHGLSNPIPAYIVFRVDAKVLAVVAGTAALAALVAGLIPAYAASRANASAVLKDSGRGHSSRFLGIVNRGLVVLQIVVTSVLLVGSALQLQSILKQQKIDFGYDTSGVLSARLGLMEGDYPDAEAKKAFFDRTLRELRANGEYEQAALTTRFRMVFTGNGPIEIEGKSYADAKDRPNANVENVSEGYFATLGARILQGRDFALDDSDQKLPVAIVNSAFAYKHFGTESPLGRRFRSADLAGQVFGPWRTIVGVVSDVRMLGPFDNPNVDASGFYVPFFATAFGPALPGPASQQFATIIVRPRAGRAAETLSKPLLADVGKIDPNLPLYFVDTPARNIDSFLGGNRVVATMFSIFGMVAVLLSAVGLYGVMSFSVNQRRQEFGTRMVLGADRRRILTMVLRQGLVQLAIGLGVGLGLALVIAQLGGSGIRQALFQVNPKDPLVYLSVSILLAAVAFLATVVPARRATRVDPALALRAE